VVPASPSTAGDAEPPRLGTLLPCPFCGGEAVVERDPWAGESVRVACGERACRVSPATEYLLVEYADELAAGWNRRG
jgi:restriction alleviation protein Lar